MGAPSSDRDPAPGCPRPRPYEPSQIEDLGPAVTGFPANAAARIGDRVYVASLGLRPSRIVAYDLSIGEVVDTVEVPTGERTWALTPADGVLYLGQWGTEPGEINLYRYDPEDDELEGLAALDNEGELWALAIGDDGVIYAGTARSGVVVTYDQDSDEVGEREVDGASGEVTAFGLDGDDLYVALGRGQAALFHLDLASGEATELTPDAIRDGVGVYALDVSADHVAIGTQQEPGVLAIVDRDDPNEVVIVTGEDEESIVGAVRIDGANVWSSGIRTGVLRRTDLHTGASTVVATPVADAPTRAAFVVDSQVVGVSGPGIVWRVAQPDGEVVARHDLLEAGATGGAEPPQSLAVTDDVVVVGTNNAIAVRQRDGDGERRRLVVAGEPKAMTAVGGDVYLALYPSGLLWRYDGATGEVREVGDWPDVQNRPRTIHRHRSSGLVAIGVTSDFEGGGALVIHDPDSCDTTTYERPFGRDEGVESIADLGDELVVGGRAPDATLAAIDPRTGEARWTATPAPSGGAVEGLAVLDDRIVGVTFDGTWFTTDHDGGDVQVRDDVVAGEPGELLVSGGRVLSISSCQLTAREADGSGAEVLIDDLDADELLTRPLVRRGPDCDLYLFRDLHLLRLTAERDTAD